MTRPRTLRQSAVSSPYRVRIIPTPAVLDADDNILANAQILEIRFPGETVDTPAGRTHVVTGAGVAKIMVGAITIRGVPLC